MLLCQTGVHTTDLGASEYAIDHSINVCGGNNNSCRSARSIGGACFLGLFIIAGPWGYLIHQLTLSFEPEELEPQTLTPDCVSILLMELAEGVVVRRWHLKLL